MQGRKTISVKRLIVSAKSTSRPEKLEEVIVRVRLQSIKQRRLALRVLDFVAEQFDPSVSSTGFKFIPSNLVTVKLLWRNKAKNRYFE